MRKALALADFGDVMHGLLLCRSRIVRHPRGFHDRDDLAVGEIEGVIRYPVPRLGVFAIDRDLKFDLGTIREVPARFGERGVDFVFASLGFI